jgi:lipopolysaccharide assembly outer membrane protein LptD (OstA)
VRTRALRGARAWLAALIALIAAPAGLSRAQAPDAEPPLHVTADHMSGGRTDEGDVVYLEGNLRVTRGRAVLTAETGRYLRTQGMLFLDGRVRVVDSTLTMTCDHARYAEATDVLEVEGNVVLTDRDATLRAPRGRYDRRAGVAELEGGFEGRDRRQKLTADRGVYVRDSSLVRARGRCRGEDEENRLVLEARAIDYDRASAEATAWGDPALRSIDDRGRETRLGALRLHLNTETRVAEAIDSVTVERDSLRGRADYALFDDRAQRGWMLGAPRLWDGQTEVRGDTVEVFSEKRAVQRVVVRGGASMDYRGNREPTAGESSLLTGRHAEIWFAGDAIDSLVAVGDARNDYVGPLRPGRTQERNQTQGDTITVFFKDRKIDRARVTGGARGEYRLAVDAGDTLAAKREIVVYEGTRITYVVPKSRIELDRGAGLRYRDLELKARRVEYDVEGQTMVAEGKPELVEKGDKVEGQLMTYDMNTRIGTIYQAETAYERGLYHGEAIRKVNENELDVLRGAYSTCSLEEPHYHFSARWMKIYLKDKLVAKPVVFYVRNVPLLALPFWVFPIKPGRHSGFLFPQFEFGLNNRSGQFLRNAGYYWAPNDYMDLTFSGDYYRAEPSWVLRTEGLYRLLYVLDGNFRGSFARNEGQEREDWDLVANHQQELTPRSRITANANFVSSRDYSSSNAYGRPLSQQVNRFLRSSMAFSHNADWASFSAFVDRSQDLDAEAFIADPDGFGPRQGPAPGTSAGQYSLLENLPSLAVSFPTRTLGSLPMFRGTALEKRLATTYFGTSSRFVATREKRAFVDRYEYFTNGSGQPDSTTRLSERINKRWGIANNYSLSDQRRAFGWLNLGPQLDANAVVFDFDALGNKVAPAATWSARANASTSIYGTFRPPIPGVSGIRHVISPRVSYAYSPEFPGLTYRDSTGALRPRFVSFGGIGVSGFEQSFLSYSIDQRLQVKLGGGDRVRRLDNLLSMSTSGTYDLRWRERGLDRGLSPQSWSLFIQPPGLLSGSAGWTTDFHQGRPLRNLGFNVGLSLSRRPRAGGGGAEIELPLEQRLPGEEPPEFREDWSLSAAYSYSGGYASFGKWVTTQTLNAILRWQFSPKWSVEYTTTADLIRRRLQTQRFGLSRDLHCWTVNFSRSFVEGGEAEYYFRIGIKDLREVFYERGNRTGSIGGIQ